MTEYFDRNFERAEIADAASGNDRNEHTIALIERMVDDGKPFPKSLANSIYLYADDYFRRKMGAPLRKRAAGQYYLGEDRYPNDRSLPYTCNPLMRTDDGYICTCVVESKKTAKRRLGLT